MKAVAGIGLASVLVAGAILAAGHGQKPYLPNPSLTPSAIRSGCTEDMVRSHSFNTASVRNVPESIKRAVCARYGVAYPWDGEIDHLIPLSSCGDNVIENLWPEPKTVNVGGKEYGYHTKDITEDAAQRAVEKGKIGLAEVQQLMRTDWTKLHERLGLTFPDVKN